MTKVAVRRKLCSYCRKRKPISEFHRHPLGKDGLQARCKPCACEVARQHYAENKEKRLATVAAWRQRNPERVQRQAHNSKLKIQHGATLEEYEVQLALQDGKCAICRTDKPGRQRRFFCWDHDHKTGLFRGLLCLNCNDGLGRFQDNPELFLAAIEYLRGTK